jgi:hypothetical protein
VEKEQAKGDGEPKEEGDYPAQVLSVEDETCNPPAVTNVSVSQEQPSAGKTMCENEWGTAKAPVVEGSKYTANLRRNIPCEKKEDEDVEENAQIHIESRERVSLPIVFLFLNWTYISSPLSITTNKSILFRMMASVEVVVLRVRV